MLPPAGGFSRVDRAERLQGYFAAPEEGGSDAFELRSRLHAERLQFLEQNGHVLAALAREDEEGHELLIEPGDFLVRDDGLHIPRDRVALFHRLDSAHPDQTLQDPIVCM